MLNKPLYDALVKAVGDVEIVNENDAGTFQIDEVPSGFARGKNARITATMVDWGEIYRFKDIVCQDYKSRAFVCHRLGTSVQVKVGSSIKRVYFSNHLAVCHRRQCQRTPEFKQFIASLKLPDDYVVTAVQKASAPQRVNAQQFIIRNVQLPVPSYTLSDPNVPAHVLEYVSSRQFDPDSLAKDFGIRYAPVNATYTVDETERKLMHERLIIPIQQHVHVISWQGRAIGNVEPKYFNLPKGHKRSWLYNFDKALMYPEVAIFEGVTNVWRTGLDSIALFGSNISLEQLNLIKTVWSYDGHGILCLDEDKWTNNQDTDVRYFKMLATEKAFANGLAILRLRNGDAAEHTHERMRQLKRLAHLKASTDPNNPGILDEADVHDDPLPEEQEPRQSTIPEDKLRELLKDSEDDSGIDMSEFAIADNNADEESVGY
jgi:hypothetical protein